MKTKYSTIDDFINNLFLITMYISNIIIKDDELILYLCVKNLLLVCQIVILNRLLLSELVIT